MTFNFTFLKNSSSFVFSEMHPEYAANIFLVNQIWKFLRNIWHMSELSICEVLLLMVNKPDYVILIKEWFEFLLFSISLCLCCLDVSLPTTDIISWRERVCVTVSVCGSFRKFSSSSKCLAVFKTFNWTYGVSHWVGLTFE